MNRYCRQEGKRRYNLHRRYIRIAELLVDCYQYFDALLLAERAATNAMYNYAGFYTDGALENLITKIGKQCLQPTKTEVLQVSSRIVHIISSFSQIGGHGKYLREWIARDTLHTHHVIITQQTDTGNDFLKAAGLNRLDASLDLLAKAAELQSHLTGAKLVVLHHSANDLVPILALSNTHLRVPVAILNHADHLPWIGSSVCDYLIEIREGFLPIDKERRQIVRGGYLPIPVTPVKTDTNRKQSRTLLGIPDKTVMLLTIASAYKFAPIGTYNFFDDIIQVLDKYPQAALFVIGIPANHELAVRHPQIIYAGLLTDTTTYKQAADLYIESFPFASFTSLLESAINGIAYQLMYNPPQISKMETVTSDEQLVWNYPSSKTEWISNLGLLISDKAYRQKCATYASAMIYQNHFQNWAFFLEKIYEDLNGQTHAVRYLADTPFSYTNNEFYLSNLQLNLFKLDSKYQMIPIPLKRRIRIVVKWFLKSKATFLFDLPFLLKFLVGKA